MGSQCSKRRPAEQWCQKEERKRLFEVQREVQFALSPRSYVDDDIFEDDGLAKAGYNELKNTVNVEQLPVPLNIGGTAGTDQGHM